VRYRRQSVSFVFISLRWLLIVKCRCKVHYLTLVSPFFLGHRYRVQQNAFPPKPRSHVDLYTSAVYGDPSAMARLAIQTYTTKTGEPPRLCVEVYVGSSPSSRPSSRKSWNLWQRLRIRALFPQHIHSYVFADTRLQSNHQSLHDTNESILSATRWSSAVHADELILFPVLHIRDLLVERFLPAWERSL